MADFSAELRLAQQLIERNGREVAFVTLTAAGVDPNRPWQTNDKPSGRPILRHAVFVPPTGGSAFGFEEEADQSAEQLVVAAGGSIDLGTSHKINDPGTGAEWTIIKTHVFRPAEDVLLYGFEVKR